MAVFRKALFTELIPEKELRLTRTDGSGLASYYCPKTQGIKLTNCEKVPSVLEGRVNSNHTIKSLPRLPSNNIMLVFMALLEEAYNQSTPCTTNNPSLLNRIKLIAYDEQISKIDILESSDRGELMEHQLRKLLVEFFHLVAATSCKNKVEKTLYKYPVIQCVLVLLARKILVMEGVSDAGNLQLPVPTIWVIQTLCKLLLVPYQTISAGLHEIGGATIAEDSGFVYKTCERESSLGDDGVRFDEEKVIDLLSLDESPFESPIFTPIIHNQGLRISEPVHSQSEVSYLNWKRPPLYRGPKPNRADYSPLTFKNSRKSDHIICDNLPSTMYTQMGAGHPTAESPLRHLTLQRSSSINSKMSPESYTSLSSMTVYSNQAKIQRQKSDKFVDHKHSPSGFEKTTGGDEFIRHNSMSNFFSQPILKMGTQMGERKDGGVESGGMLAPRQMNYQYGY